MGIPVHLTCLLRNLYAGQEATVRTGHGTTDWFQIGKGVCQGCVLSPYLFNFHAEYIMQNARLDESQAGIKISRRNINNLRYADDTTLMAESEELKTLLINVKEESEKVGLKLNIQKTKIMASGPTTSWETDGETVADFIFLGSKITAPLQTRPRWLSGASPPPPSRSLSRAARPRRCRSSGPAASRSPRPGVKIIFLTSITRVKASRVICCRCWRTRAKKTDLRLDLILILEKLHGVYPVSDL